MRTATILHRLLIVSLASQACSCTSKTIYADPDAPQSKFLASIASFPYRVAPERENALLKGYRNLTEGMDQDQVFELFGEPDAKNMEIDSLGKTVGDRWMYYIAIRTNPTANRNDHLWEVITVCFDEDGKLYYAAPRNLAGLSQIGRNESNLLGLR